MKRIIRLYLLLVIIAVLGYGFTVADWTDVKTVGPDAFPGSPDWGYMYASAYENYLWMSGALFGLTIGAIALFVSARTVSSMSRNQAAMAISAIGPPALALAIGYVL